MSKIVDKFEEKFDRYGTYVLIVLIILLGFFFCLNSAGNVNFHASADDALPVDNSLVRPIQKTEKLIEVEKKLMVEREIKEKDGFFTVKAKIKNLDVLEDDFVIQDFVDELRFDSKVDILFGKVEPYNGVLFPPGNKLKIASYGPGPKSNKNTSVSVVLLDLNFTNNSEDGLLYELNFKLEDSAGFDFKTPELRSHKYILEIEDENNWIK